jgi:ABC-type uncharacterized transport system substrate-binding protein
MRIRIGRREFITALGGAAAWPLVVRAQQSKMARIGVLYIQTADAESLKKELREGLRELGYVEGQNIAFEFRSAEGQLDRLPELATELVRLKVDVIVAYYVAPSLAAKQATRDIPTVILAGDPVEMGIVPSLANPGGNITGVSLMGTTLAGKSVELFHDILPSVRRVGILGHTTNPVYAKTMLDKVLLVGGPIGIEIQPVVMVRGPEEFESAFKTFVRERADATVVRGSLGIKPVADLAIKYRVPTASTSRAFAETGGLMSFGPNEPAAFRYSAKFVQSILQGTHPKDLPIEQSTKFELVINSRLRRLSASRFRKRSCGVLTPCSNEVATLLRCICPLLAQSGHHDCPDECPLLGVKRTSPRCITFPRCSC